MTDHHDDDETPASEALKEARALSAAKQRNTKKRNTWVAGAVATGIGSAALAAALLYANRGKKKGD